MRSNSELLKEIKNARHLWEMPLLASAIIFTAATAIMILSLFYFLAIIFLSDNTMSYFVIISLLGTFLLFLLIFTACLIIRGARYGYAANFGIRIGEDNFSEIYQKAKEISLSLGLKKVPEIYIINRKGAIMSHCSKLLRKSFITISYEMVEEAYLKEERDYSAVYFALSRELSHLALSHASLSLALITAIPSIIPIYGPLIMRSRCYSADRAASIIMGYNASKEFSAYIIGARLNKYVNVKSSLNRSGIIFRLIYNIFSWTPTSLERLRALENPEKDGRLFL